jgi:hypothetical protein
MPEEVLYKIFVVYQVEDLKFDLVALNHPECYSMGEALGVLRMLGAQGIFSGESFFGYEIHGTDGSMFVPLHLNPGWWNRKIVVNCKATPFQSPIYRKIEVR